MGYGMPGAASRGQSLRRLDELLNENPQGCLEALACTEDSVFLTAVKIVTGRPPTGEDKVTSDHVDLHWYRRTDPAKNDYFKVDKDEYSAEVRKEISRQGYIRALEEALYDEAGAKRECPLKIESIWICSGKNFEVCVVAPQPDLCEQRRTVVVILLTGSVRQKFKTTNGKPVVPFKQETKEDIWVSTSTERAKEARAETNPGEASLHATPGDVGLKEKRAADFIVSDRLKTQVEVIRPRTKTI